MKRSDITDEEVLAMCRFCGEYSPTPALRWLQEKGYERKVAEAKLLHMCNRGLIDYGTSLNYVWMKS